MCNMRRDSFFIFLTANNSNHIKFVAVTVAVTIAITIANADVVFVASFSSSSSFFFGYCCTSCFLDDEARARTFAGSQ